MAPKPVQLYVQPDGRDVRIGQIVVEGADLFAIRRHLELIDEGGPLDLRAVREAVRQLHTSRRFASVAAFVEAMPHRRGGPPNASWVRLVFVVAPVSEVRAVNFEGQRALPEAALKSTANLSGAYSAAQLQKAVNDILAQYRRIGYRKASVTATQHEVPGGVEIRFAVREGPPTRIGELIFEGELGLSREALASALRLGPGDVLDQAQLEDGLRALRERFRKAGRLRARVEAPRVVEAGGERVKLVLRVQAGPQVSFHFRGNRAFSDRVLRAQLGPESDDPLDNQGLQEIANRLRRFYVAQGFLKTRLMTREVAAKSGELMVFFSIAEDKPVRVEQIAFTGNTAVKSEQLVEMVENALREGTSVDPAFGADPADVEKTGVLGRTTPSRRRYHVEPSTVFDPLLYARAIRDIEDLYKSQGFLGVQVGPPKLEQRPDNTATVRIPVREGEQARVASIRIEGGGSDVTQAELAAALSLQRGGVFSYLAAEEGRGRITQLFTGRGHLYAKVEDEESFEEPDLKSGPRPVVRVHVTYRIQPGPLVRVSLVKVESQDPLRTVEGLIYDLVAIKAGDVLKPETMDRAQQALLRTGLFYSATLTPMNPQLEEPEKVLQVSLRERPTRSFLGSVGFSLNDGPRTTLQFVQGNLFGRNLTANAIAKFNFPFPRYSCSGKETLAECANGAAYRLPGDYIERNIVVGLSTPRLYPLTDALRGSFDLIHVRETRDSYNRTTYSGQVATDTVRRRPVSAGITFEIGKSFFEDTRPLNSDVTLTDVEKRLLRQPTGEMFFGSLRPQVTLDLRDEPGRTRKGFFAQLGGDFMRSLTTLSFHTNLFRLQGLAAGYVPMPLGSSLLLSARGGYVFHFDDESKTPPDRRFYLGGASTLRGFAEESLQPEDVRIRLRNEINLCKQTLSRASCSSLVNDALQGTSIGGDLFAAVRAEARVPVGGAWELALFYDAGNMLSAPRADTTKLSDMLNAHHAVGTGMRYATPIGRMALDLGVNLNPDDVIGERRVGIYFSIDTL